MSVLFRHHRSQAKQVTELKGLRSNSSVYGAVLPVLYGRNRLAGNLIWFGDFKAIPHTQQFAGKGGLFSGGGKGGSVQNYTYQGAVAVALCEGIGNAIVQDKGQGIFTVWDTLGPVRLTTVTETYTVTGGGGSYTVTQAANFWYDNGVSRGDTYSVNANDYGSPGPVTLTGTQQTPMVYAGSAATGQYSRSAGVYTFAAGDAGKVMTISYVYATPVSGTNGTPASLIGFALFQGTRPQSPWSYLTSLHPGQDLSYSGITYLGFAQINLGASAAMPNLSYELQGLFPYGGGIVDANPKDVINDLLTNSLYGAGLAAAEIADLSAYSNFCVANGLFISPLLDTERPAHEWLKEWLEITDAEAFWTGGQLKVVPYGDTTVVGNGVTYSPATTPAFDLGDDDYIVDATSGHDPVVIERPTLQDAENTVKIEFRSRANDYNPEIVEEKDQNAIEVNRVRHGSPRQHTFLCTQTAAALAANLLLKRKTYIRNIYRFKLGWKYCVLEPMDIVTLTDANLGLSKQPVRIKRITEQKDSVLEIEAEEFPYGAAQAVSYPKQTAAPYVAAADADPGNVNAPYIFEAPNRISGQIGYSLWLAVSGAGANWGGCTVWVSADGTSFKAVGKIVGPARMGVLSSALPTAVDPDTVDTVGVDLTQSIGTLTSGTVADADGKRTLCIIDNELISFSTVTLVSTSKYNLSGYIRRGVFGTAIAAHAQGAPFVRLDTAIYEYPYDAVQIGSTLTFKFTSFNQRGQMEQSLANVTPYTFTVTGAALGLLSPAHATYRPTTNPLAGHDPQNDALIPVPYASFSQPLAAGARMVYSGETSQLRQPAGHLIQGAPRFARVDQPAAVVPQNLSGATIYITGFTMRVAGVDIPVNSGAISGLIYGTIYYVYYDDPGFVGGAVTYVATQTKETVLNKAGRFFVGSVTTPYSGDQDTVGNNDGGSGAQQGIVTKYYFSAHNLTNAGGANASVSNPANIYDANTNSKAVFTGSQGFAGQIVRVDLINLTGVRSGRWREFHLKLLYEVTLNNMPPPGTCFDIYISADGGLSWTDYGALGTPPNGGIVSAGQTKKLMIWDSGDIGLSQLTLGLKSFQARISFGGFTLGSGSIVVNVYEAWVEVTE